MDSLNLFPPSFTCESHDVLAYRLGYATPSASIKPPQLTLEVAAGALLLNSNRDANEDLISRARKRQKLSTSDEDAEAMDFPNEASQIQQNSPLLNLPPELRNIIYEYALIDDPFQNVNVNRFDHTEPGLLRCCREMRQEASPLFYIRDAAYFTLDVDDWKFEPQVHHWIFSKVDSDSRAIDFYGTPKWENLKVWLELIHEGQLDFSDRMVGCEGDRMDRIVIEAFSLATHFREYPWEMVEVALEAFKVGAEAATAVADRLRDRWN